MQRLSSALRWLVCSENIWPWHRKSFVSRPYPLLPIHLQLCRRKQRYKIAYRFGSKYGKQNGFFLIWPDFLGFSKKKNSFRLSPVMRERKLPLESRPLVARGKIPKICVCVAKQTHQAPWSNIHLQIYVYRCFHLLRNSCRFHKTTTNTFHSLKGESRWPRIVSTLLQTHEYVQCAYSELILWPNDKVSAHEKQKKTGSKH